MSEVKNWIFEYISKIDFEFSKKSEDEKLLTNLFDSQRLDSMSLMNLLLDAEESFGFAFDAESFQDRRLQSVFGIIEIITERTTD